MIFVYISLMLVSAYALFFVTKNQRRMRKQALRAVALMHLLDGRMK